MRQISFIAFVFLIVSILASGSGTLQARPIVVFPFENMSRNTTIEWIGESFVETFNEQLEFSPLTPIRREQRNAAYDLLGLPYDRDFSVATLIKISGELDVPYALVGFFQYDSSVFSATARVINLETHQLEFEITEKGTLEELKKIQSRMAWRILTHFDSMFPTNQEEFYKQFGGVPLSAFENYVRGVHTLDRRSQLKYFLKAERIFPGYSKAIFRIGKIYFEDKDYSTALLWLRRISKEERHSREATFYLGLAYYFTNHFEKSAAAFTSLAAEVPLNEVFNNLAVALSRMGTSNQVVKNYQEAIQGDPGDPDFYFNLGYYYWKVSNFSSAVKYLRETLRLRSEDAEAVYLLALSLRSMQLQEQSTHYLKQAARLNPKVAAWKPGALPPLERVKLNYDAVSFRELKTTLDSLNEEKISRLPLAEHFSSHIKRGIRFYNELHDNDAAEEFKQALSLDPDSGEAHFYMGRIYEREGSYEQAIQEWKGSIHTPSAVEAHVALAHLYFTLERRREAEDQVEAALIIAPENAAAREMKSLLQQGSQLGKK